MKKVLFSIFLFGNLWIHSQVNLTNGLTGYFPLDGNTNDLSVTSINGTNHGATSTNGYSGTPNTGMHFNSIQSDYMDAGNNTRGYVDKMSLSFWFRVSGSGSFELAEKYNWTMDAGFYIRMINGQIYFHGRDQTGVGHAPAPSSNQYNDGEWHHLVAVVNITHWMLYVDCHLIQDYVTNSVNPDISVNYPLTFGRYTYGNDCFLNGDLDDIRLYNRVVSDAEISLMCRDVYSVDVEEADDKPTFTIFVSPVDHKVYIKGLEKWEDDYQIKVYNMLGQEILQVKNQSTIDISNFSSGVYIVEILDTSNHRLHSQKITHMTP